MNEEAWPTLFFLAGMWVMGVIVSASQNRFDTLMALVAAPVIAGVIVYLLNKLVNWKIRKDK